MTLARRLLPPLIISLVLAACGTPSSAPPNAPRTASDQTDADRRASVRIELAAGYFSRGQYSTALDEVKQALVLHPGMREAINLRGLIYGAMGERALAEDSFRGALTLYPNDPDTLHNYGWMLCQQRRFAEADQQFELALAQQNYRAPARTLLAKGVCEAQAQKSEAAEKTLLRAFEFDPGNPAVAYNLADVLYRNRQYERARFYIKRLNAQPEQANAQTLWLGLRVERRMGDAVAVGDLGRQMRQRFSDAPETQALNAERFDD
ncbi:MAG: type IV pilus biogenesis/stability protein PilW [Paucibacter sp.]|nr:type IV pilus biogenesis/stability protein PilW [Roseateles sp.]